ncbi:hypothetical protein V6N11_071097 [Hibiscus sabdariffa]|uniref:Uncharacterized protein n=2 Tax=Hibiscus sabdariffa TaxID=183260 RepID=A0ABR2BIG3_9ROSI
MVCDEGGNAHDGSDSRIPMVGEAMSKTSFRDTLTGRHGNNSSSPVITYLYVEVLDDDVQISYVDGTPMIQFLDRVHGLVDAKLANTVIVQLLGRTIGSGSGAQALDEGGLAGKGVVASKVKVVHSVVTLNPSNHTTIRVLERRSKLAVKVVVA